MSVKRVSSITYRACACAWLTAENAWPNSSGVRAFTKLNSIDSDGAAALSSSITFGLYGVSRFHRTATPVSSWDRLLEQLQPLGAEVGRHHREPGDVSARMREVRDQAGADWISHQGHDKRDGGRSALQRTGRDRTVRDDHIDLALNQIGGELPVADRSRRWRIATRPRHRAPRRNPPPLAPAGTLAPPCSRAARTSEKHPDAPRRCWLQSISSAPSSASANACGQGSEYKSQQASVHRTASSVRNRIGCAMVRWRSSDCSSRRLRATELQHVDA